MWKVCFSFCFSDQDIGLLEKLLALCVFLGCIQSAAMTEPDYARVFDVLSLCGVLSLVLPTLTTRLLHQGFVLEGCRIFSCGRFNWFVLLLDSGWSPLFRCC